jgi:hypothetical protein
MLVSFTSTSQWLHIDSDPSPGCVRVRERSTRSCDVVEWTSGEQERDHQWARWMLRPDSLGKIGDASDLHRPSEKQK